MLISSIYLNFEYRRGYYIDPSWQYYQYNNDVVLFYLAADIRKPVLDTYRVKSPVLDRFSTFITFLGMLLYLEVFILPRTFRILDLVIYYSENDIT